MRVFRVYIAVLVCSSFVCVFEVYTARLAVFSSFVCVFEIYTARLTLFSVPFACIRGLHRSSYCFQILRVRVFGVYMARLTLLDP